MILLSVACGVSLILLVILVVVTRAGLRSSRRLQEYEAFYEASISDVSETLEYLKKLMQRQLVSDDPDVQNVRKLIEIHHDTLVGYANASITEETKNKKKEGKRKK